MGSGTACALLDLPQRGENMNGASVAGMTPDPIAYFLSLILLLDQRL